MRKSGALPKILDMLDPERQLPFEDLAKIISALRHFFYDTQVHFGVSMVALYVFAPFLNSRGMNRVDFFSNSPNLGSETFRN